MCRRLTCLIAFFLILNVAGNTSANLVAHWKFDAGSGSTAYDSSGNGYHGTIFGDPQWITGHLGGALDFDGNDDYVELPIGSLLSSLTNSTFATWVDFSNEGGAWQRIFDFGIDTTFNMFLTPRMGTDGAMRFAITITSWNDEDQTTAPMTLASGWHHVAVTLDADNNIHLLYLDGELIAENPNARYTPSSLGVTTQNWLGRSQYSIDGYFDGRLDDFRIYNRVLTTGQVMDLYNDNLPTLTQACDPNPQDGAIHPDIWVTLSWKPGDFAVSHNVYFGTNFEHVNKASLANPLGVLVSQGQKTNTYEPPDPLDIRQTYYWRIDEVEEGGFTIHKGNVWSFNTYNFDPFFDAVYTTDEDFDLGILIGVEHESVHDQLQLSLQHVTLPFIWVPNSNEGTVSKVDTRTGRELGRYRTGPEGRNGNPSRTTVDLYGNCWVGNRDTGTVVKIGLLENGQYVDRNFNGVIETSTDLNGDGQITGDEILPWASDECVIHEVVIIPGSEGTYFPGQYQGAYANDHWNPGPRGIAIDSTNNLWVGCHDAMIYYYIDGDTGQILHKIDVSSVDHTPYGAVVDENGILWSSGQDKNHVLRLNPADFSFTIVGLNHFVYGLGIDGMGHLFVSGWENTKLSCIDIHTARVLWTKTGGNSSRGVACTDDGDVWVADSGSGLVSRYDNQGNVKQRINIGYTPTGVSVDGTGKVWTVCLDGGYLFRIDPVTNQVDLTKVIANTQHYGYSDMTGIVSRTYTAHFGSWKVLHCAGAAPVSLGPIFWTVNEPPGAFLDVFVRSTIDRSQWSAWEFICNGRAPRRTPAGCYYEIEAMFEGSAEGASPILYDLTVTPASFVDVQDEGP